VTQVIERLPSKHETLSLKEKEKKMPRHRYLAVLGAGDVARWLSVCLA
jgi:hypothetical protein